MADSELPQVALANTMENFGYIFRSTLEGLFIDRMEQNEEITARFLNNGELKRLVSQNLLQQVYEQVRAEGEAAVQNRSA